ncbi:MAG: PilZ domain-containing protein [Terriglobia bacterium]
MGEEKRRSDRLMLTIPLEIRGTDTRGKEFREDARTLTLNRHGARIHITRPLARGQVVLVTNLVGRRGADFRVVGPLSPVTERGGEWGVECCDPAENIWGIQFPPSADGSAADPTALLECRVCHAVALMRVSLVEVEVLQTSGILSRDCASCGRPTAWGFAEKQVAMGGPADESAMMVEAQATVREGALGIEQRKHRRVSLQLTALVRDYYGGSEIARTENVSKGGFCFASAKHYHVGEGVIVVCPYNPAGEKIETQARVVRSRPVEGTNRKIYGVRYDAPTG